MEVHTLVLALKHMGGDGGSGGGESNKAKSVEGGGRWCRSLGDSGKINLYH